ncbi:hypothetical protein LLG46_02410 [bacterium]|nr:hypothetical protein [bacterium]
MSIVGEDSRRSLKFTTKGYTGTKYFKVTSFTDDIDDTYNTDLPCAGDAWSTARPYLRCVSVDTNELDGGFGEAIANYSTERELAESFVDLSKSFGLEQQNITRGYIWTNAGTPVEIDIPVYMPVTTWTLKCRRDTDQSTAIRAAQGKINSVSFFGCAAGYLRFDGAEQDESYTAEGALISVNVTYHFTETVILQNYFWRPPLQAVDSNQQPRRYQDADSEAPDYSTDPAQIGTPVYVSGTAGTGAFDIPKDPTTSEPIYASCDFTSVLGLPG